MRLYVAGKPTYQRAGSSHVRLDDGNEHVITVRFDVARKRLSVTIDDAHTPALSEQMISAVLEQIERGGGYARIGVTAGSGLQELRPLVLHSLSVTAALAVPPSSLVEPSPADGYVGRVGRECVFVLHPRTACGLPSVLVRTWRVFAQATTSAMEGSVARGHMIAATLTPPEAAREGEGAARQQTTFSLAFVPELAGMHRILILDTAEGAAALPYAVGEVLVLQ